MTPEERADLLAGYALGTLSAPDAAAAAALVRSDDEAAIDVQSYRDTADLIAFSVPLGRADPKVRTRVMREARRDQQERLRVRSRRRFSVRRYAPAAAVIALLTAIGLWGAGMQQTIGELRRETAALVAVVEADAKRIEALQASEPASLAQSFALQRVILAEEALAEAVLSDPERRVFELDATTAAHGGTGRYTWSRSVDAGLLELSNLQPLPLGSVYGVWLEGATLRSVYVGAVDLDASGTGRFVVRDTDQIRPVRLLVMPVTGDNPEAGKGPVVLAGSVID